MSLFQTGAFSASFDGNPDEAVHLMTGVLVRDYLVSNTPLPPRQYAERQYIAYPKIAFGVWPPLFHFAEGFWFLLFEPSRISAIFLMAALSSLAAVVAFVTWRAAFGATAAAALATCLLVAPRVSEQFSLVIADALLFPLVLAAAWSFGRFLESHRLRDSLTFGLLAGLAMLTKYNGFLLVFVPVLGIALTRQWRLFADWRLWVAPLVVLAVAGPWYAWQRSLVYYAADMGVHGFDPIASCAWKNLVLLATYFGPVCAALILLGLGAALLRKGRISSNAAVALGLILGTWLMHSVVYPIVDRRYLLPALPALLFFVYQGLVAVASLLRPWVSRRVVLATLGLASFVSMLAAGPSGHPGSDGWGHVATELQKSAKTDVLMISGSGNTEGAVVAEVALMDRQRHVRPSWTVLRGSKMLASSSWMGAGYRLRHHTAGAVRASLDAWRVSAVAVDMRYLVPAHQRLLLDAVSFQGGGWREHPSPIPEARLFLRTGLPAEPARAISIDLSHSLGRTVAPAVSTGPDPAAPSLD